MTTYKRGSTRPVTAYCRACHHHIGIFDGTAKTCVCELCESPIILDDVRLMHLENGSGRSVTPYDTTAHLRPKKNAYMKNPRPIERLRLELRLDHAMQRQVNGLIVKQNRTASDIIRDAVGEYAEKHGIT